MPRFLLQGLENLAGHLPKILSTIIGIAAALLFLRFGPSSPAYLVFPLAVMIGVLFFRLLIRPFCHLLIWMFEVELKIFFLIAGFVFAMVGLVVFLNALAWPVWLNVLVALGESVLFTVLVVRGTTRIRY